MSRPRVAAERGAMAIVVIGLVAVALGLTMAVARLGAALVGRARAENAADAAALAAATDLALGGSADSSRLAASESAAHNGGRLVSCTCDGPRVEVVVEVAVAALTALGGPVLGGTARAHAAAEVQAVCMVDPECGAGPG